MSSGRERNVLARLEGENIEEKIEVIASEEGTPSIEIRSLRWGRGIGWYVQKTIILDGVQVNMLMRALRRSVARSAKKSGKGNVISFPRAFKDDLR
jgi:hypothetical protein